MELSRRNNKSLTPERSNIFETIDSNYNMYNALDGNIDLQKKIFEKKISPNRLLNE